MARPKPDPNSAVLTTLAALRQEIALGFQRVAEQVAAGVQHAEAAHQHAAAAHQQAAAAHQQADMSRQRAEALCPEVETLRREVEALCQKLDPADEQSLISIGTLALTPEEQAVLSKLQTRSMTVIQIDAPA